MKGVEMTKPLRGLLWLLILSTPALAPPAAGAFRAEPLGPLTQDRRPKSRSSCRTRRTTRSWVCLVWSFRRTDQEVTAAAKVLDGRALERPRVRARVLHDSAEVRGVDSGDGRPSRCPTRSGAKSAPTSCSPASRRRRGNDFEVEFRILATRADSEGRQTFGKAYTCRFQNPRACAHYIADDIHKDTRALDGVAQTKLAFVSDRHGSARDGPADARRRPPARRSTSPTTTARTRCA